MKPEIQYPNFDFPFQAYDAKIPGNNFRVGKSIDNVTARVNELQNDRREVEGITIDGSDNTFLHDDGLSINKTNTGYIVQVSVVDTPEFVIPEQKLFIEALRRLESVYMFKNVSFMLPKQIINILSLSEGKTRPAITIELEFDDNGEVISVPNIYKSYFRNVKAFSERTFGRQFLNYGSPFHNDLHLHAQFAKKLRERRIGGEDSLGTNYIPLHELIIAEIVVVINAEIAKLAHDNGIPIAYAHRLNGDFRYSHKVNKSTPYSRVTCPGRRVLDMVTLGQIVTYTESDGGKLLFGNSFFADLSRYNNTRSPFLDEHTENQLVHIEAIRDARRTKRFQANPEQMSDEDIQYFFYKSTDNVSEEMKTEVELRIKKGAISNATLAYVLFSGVRLSDTIIKLIYAKIKHEAGYGYFFKVLKEIKHISYRLISCEEDGKIKHEAHLEIYGRKITKEFLVEKASESQYKSRVEISNQKQLQKHIQEFILQEYITQLYSQK